jgi:hypothetical protein
VVGVLPPRGSPRCGGNSRKPNPLVEAAFIELSSLLVGSSKRRVAEDGRSRNCPSTSRVRGSWTMEDDSWHVLTHPDHRSPRNVCLKKPFKEESRVALERVNRMSISP